MCPIATDLFSISIFKKVLLSMLMVILVPLECLPGYFGTNCSTRCIYPIYGKRCQNTCDCNVTECNHVLGCQGNYSQNGTSTGWYRVQTLIKLKLLYTCTCSCTSKGFDITSLLGMNTWILFPLHYHFKL